MSISEWIAKGIGVVLALLGLGIVLAAFGASLFGLSIPASMPAVLAVIVGLLLIGVGIYTIRGGTISA